MRKVTCDPRAIGGSKEGRGSEGVGHSGGEGYVGLNQNSAGINFYVTTQTSLPPHQGLKFHLDLLKSKLHWE